MLRIIIVDDEDMIRNAIAKMIDFPALGYELIATAKNGIEAYDIICDSYPDVVLTDIKMPGLSGLELIEQATHLDANIDYIILSGYGEFELAKQAIQFGVKNFILKPTDKNELIDTLISIRDERTQRKKKSRHETSQLLNQYLFPIQECFIIESLEYLHAFESCYQRYSHLLNLPEEGLNACVCSYVEQVHIPRLQEDIHQILKSLNIALVFPFIAVKGSLLMILKSDDLNLHAIIKEKIEHLTYTNQKSSYAVFFLHKSSSHSLFETIFSKISRYNSIELIRDDGNRCPIQNNVTSPWKLSDISQDIIICTSKPELKSTLEMVFLPSHDLNTCKNLAIALFIQIDSTGTQSDIDFACHFFKRIYSVTSHEELINIFIDSILSRLTTMRQSDSKSKTLIESLKEYVKTHLDSQSLSLKWIAQNHLFVSVGYLSKQFVKEEGMRFSEYLNTLRMDEATKLLSLYPSTNIKAIAQQVGFGNNPHYFSQVFKKHTGYTPSEYIDYQKE